jgi:nitrogen fixation/metabolism regulation signal transduction histidine kinase
MAYSRDLRGIRMDQLSSELRHARDLVESIQSRDLRRGFTLTLLVLLGAAWILSLAPLIYIAHRISRPIRHLTEGLTDFAAGDWSRRVSTGSDPGTPPRDEVGRAVEAFNRMADQLRQSRDRLVHLTQIASWQSLARKTAHEVKNSLTPIRLTVEEMQARLRPADRTFLDQAVQIVVSEIDALERRVRAFSDFSSEPPVHPEVLDANALVNERISLLRPVHAETTYHVRLDGHIPRVHVDADLARGILTNLLQNAAEAAGPGGSVLAITRAEDGHVAIEIHDSGPGLSEEAAGTLFEPTITFKEHGMGLGLSIAKRHALLSGGDIILMRGELPGAAFKVTLPAATGNQGEEQLR